MTRVLAVGGVLCAWSFAEAALHHDWWAVALSAGVVVWTWWVACDLNRPDRLGHVPPHHPGRYK